MKFECKTKKALLLILSMAVIFVCFGVSLAFAGNADCSHDNIGEDGWLVTKEPTCMTYGQKTKTCPDCGNTVTFSIDPYGTAGDEGHTIGPWVTLQPHSCNDALQNGIVIGDGIDVRRCVECNKELDRRTVPAHDYKQTFYIAPTCLKTGYKVEVCMTCNKIKTTNLPVDLVNGHSWDEWYISKKPTCSQPGERKRICLNADESMNFCTHVETEEIPADESLHNVTSWSVTTPATCFEEGEKKGICTVCNQEITSSVGKHEFNENYNELKRDEATCVHTGISYRQCKGCGMEYEAVIPVNDNNHVYTDWVVTKEPCCVVGERTKYCLYEKIHVDNDATIKQDIPATGEHKWGEWVVTEESTCSSTGEKERICGGCGEVQTEVLPISHKFYYWETVQIMVCEEDEKQDGVKKAYCNNCSAEKFFTIPAVHDMSGWEITQRPDCRSKKNGLRTMKCYNCSYSVSEEFAYEHSYTEWSVTEYPNCNLAQGGIYTRYCTVCHDKQTKAIPATHKYDNWEIITYPSCDSDNNLISGIREGSCSFCGTVTTQEFSCEHKFSPWAVTKKADCKLSTNGEKERACYACGYKEKMTVYPEHIVNWTAKNPLADVCGGNVAITGQCSVCKKTIEDVSTTEHPNLKVSIIKASCGESGYTSEFCPDCEYSKIYDIVPAKGHELDEKWTDRILASCSAPGEKYKACANCDYLEYVYIQKTEHSHILLVEGVDPTCTETGLTPKTYCGVCKQVFEQEVIPAAGHVFTGDKDVCSVCYAYFDFSDAENGNIGSFNCSCSCHNQLNPMTTFIFNIINKINQLFGINQYCACHTEEKPCLHYDEPGIFAQLFGKKD